MRLTLLEDPAALGKSHLPFADRVITWKKPLQYTPLYFACAYDHVECVRFLLEAGANIPLEFNYPWIPHPNENYLYSKNICLVDERKDRDPKSSDTFPRSVNYLAILELLIQHGYRVNREMKASECFEKLDPSYWAGLT